MVTLKNIHKSFGDKDILKGIDLHVEEGEKIAIIGPSGCGKSTLLRMILGLQEPDNGDVIVDKKTMALLSPRELRAHRCKIGMLFQHGALFDSLTVGENVAFVLQETLNLDDDLIHKTVDDILNWIEMPGYHHSMPSELSGGQQKRIGLARAIAGNPKIVLYDEPTTGLDPVLSTNIENLIVKLNEERNVTSITVTHQISTILRTADKIYLLDKGRLLAPESPKTIMKSKNDIIRHFMNGGLDH